MFARRAAGAKAPAYMTGLKAITLAGLFWFSLLFMAQSAFAIGPNAVMFPTGWNANAIPRGDDTFNQVVNLPFAMNWMGTSYTQIYLNMNGNVTFGNSFITYTPTNPLGSVGQAIMSPFWADVDTRYAGSGQMYFSDITSAGVPAVNGHKALLVTWSDVMAYSGNTASQTPTNTFQVVLIDRSDTGAGNFDFMFNYDKVAWDVGAVSGTQHARAGWATTTGQSYELRGSGSTTSTQFLDSAPSSTSLVQNSLNSGGQLGRYVWQVRGGAPPNAVPSIFVNDRVLEGNVLNGYWGYTGSADATATDVDGSIVSFTSSLPATLPLGSTNVTWTAVDNDGASNSDTQSVVVTDTTAPSAPVVTSSTHTAGIWTTVPTVTVDSVNAIDGCTGMGGASYVWSLDTTAAPDAVFDSSTISTVTTVSTTTVNAQPFATATWPTDWVRSDTTYARLTNAAGHNHGTYAAEVWANNNTRRTVTLYRDYDLSMLDSATLTFWDSVSALAGGSDYARVEYSTDGGATYTQLQNLTAASAWTERSYPLPVATTVRVRLSASVRGAGEYADWDDISVQGTATATYSSLSTSMTAGLADGTWFFNFRAVDGAGNWSATQSFGPVLIDRNPPVTSDNIPSVWATGPVTVSLVASDAGAGVSYTQYQVNGGSVTTYTAPFTISAEQTNTVTYWSVDVRGNAETTHTATVRIDAGAPTVPTGFSASAVTTTSVEMAWTPSSDSTSGVSLYRIYQDGVQVATSSATTFTLSGLAAGATHAFSVAAVDVAGNVSARSSDDTETMPISQIWLTLDPTAMSIGGVDPGIVSTFTSATAVTVGGVGSFAYDLSVSCADFSNVASGSITPTMPASLMSYQVYGSGTVPLTPFSTTSQLVATDVGVNYVWLRPYYFDYTLNVPWSFAPGTYTTQVTYTAVAR